MPSPLLRFAVPLLALVVAACGGPSDPAPVTLVLEGAVRAEGTLAPVQGARVVLLDRRASIDPGHMLGSSFTNALGQYEMITEARRPGYVAGCEFLVLYVEGHEFTSGKSVGCTSARQTIDFLLP